METSGNKSIESLTRLARLAAVGDAARRTVVTPDYPRPDKPRDEAKPAPQLELFHFTMSICSQKSRTALFEAGLPFASNDLVIMPPLNENYTAAYVELRMASQIAREREMVGSYSGASGVGQEGFDPLVVPTLVDHESQEVIADSKLITLHADKMSGGKLIPTALRDKVMKEVEVVDTLPHPGLFYGVNPSGDSRPALIQKGMTEAHNRKIEQVRKHMDALPSGSKLRKAYEHKIMKEEAGRAFISDPDNMRKIISLTEGKIAGFEQTLGSVKGEWATGNQFTLADIFWGVSLFRLLYLGYDWMWTSRPLVAAYTKRAFARPSIQDGVIDWPGHPPGDRIVPYQKKAG
jgi:2,5-dichlorohydroquinone reductive dechlorinase